MLSIIIPARNEADNLKDILDYFNTKLVNINFEVLIINDFSEFIKKREHCQCK